MNRTKLFFILSQHHKNFYIFDKNSYKMSIGTRVRQYREAKNWSQEDLAMRLDTTQTTISNIESDKNIPNSLLLNKIAQELEVNINDLLNDSTIISNNELHDQSAINQYNPTFNIQSPEMLETILKNQEQIAKLMEVQSKLIESLLKKG
jgi:transcriptional regulator with XRE-family HTH domain